MVEVAPRIYDPDGDAVARLGAAPVDDFKGCMGLVGLDHFQPGSGIHGLQVLLGDLVSPGLGLSHRDTTMVGGFDAESGTGGWLRGGS